MKYLPLILVVIFYSCNSLNSRNHLKELYPSGELMISTATTNDNRLEGELKYFDRNGKVITTQRWINGHFNNELDFYDTNLIDFYTELFRIEIDSNLVANDAS